MKIYNEMIEAILVLPFESLKYKFFIFLIIRNLKER